MSERMKLVIDRERWLRGEGWANSRLLRRGDNKMCCLGFYALARGATEDSIRGRGAPQVARRAVDWGPLLNGEAATSVCENLMEANDDRRLPEDEREAALTNHFAKIGVDVEFIDSVTQTAGRPPKSESSE